MSSVSLLRNSLLAFAVIIAAAPSVTHRAAAAPDNTFGMALLAANVNAAGTLLAGSGTNGTVTHPNTGTYYVHFDRPVSQCFFAASLLLDDGQARVGPAGGNIVFVLTRNSTGVAIDTQFHLLVYCPR